MIHGNVKVNVSAYPRPEWNFNSVAWVKILTDKVGKGVM